MRIYNKYIVSLALASCLINSLLALFGQNDLEIYFTVNIVTYFAITLLYVHFNPRARKALNTVTAVFFAGFMVTLVLKSLDILSGK